MTEEKSSLNSSGDPTLSHRKLAEQRIRAQEAEAKIMLSPEEMRRLIHELRVDQIELKMQNEELRGALQKKNLAQWNEGVGVEVLNDISESKIAEESLRKSEKLYRELFENMLNGFAYCQMLFDENDKPWDFIYLSVNHSFESLTGLRNVVGKKATEVIPRIRETDLQLLEIYGRVAKSGQPERFERLVESLQMWFSVSVYCPGPGYFVAVFDVITERKKNEQMLRESRSRLEAALSSMTDAVFISDVTGQFIEFNEAFATFHKFKNKDECAKKLVDYHEILDVFMANGELAPLEMWAVPRALRGETGTNVEYTLHLKKTGETWIGSYNFAPIRDKDGLIVGSVVVGRDITDRKRAEEALSRTKERLELAQRSANAGVWDWDMTKEHLDWSRELFLLFGLDPDKDMANFETWNKVLHPDDLETASRKINQAVKDKTTLHNEYRIIYPNGEVHWISALGNTTYDPSGQPLRMAGICLDITEQKRAVEEKEKLLVQLNHAQKMESIGRLAGGVAHDFNNMLGVILGYVDIALKNMDQPQRLQKSLSEINDAAQRSADLTRQLLAFARKQSIIPEVIDLNRTVTGMLKILQRLIGENIALNWLLEANLWSVKVDPSQIDQILANLCVNSRDAIPGVGKIVIETGNETFDEVACASHTDSTPGEYVRLTVSDNGHGMDEETLSHIFEPFFTTKVLGKGTGLGLATVYGAVKQNNGFIDVRSKPGQGTIFSIYLPRHLDRSRKMDTEVKQQMSLWSNETILVVEDEPSLLELITLTLERQGYTVIPAGTPTEAIRLVTKHAGEIHLLLTDVIMPEMNGWNLEKNIRSLFPRIKSLFISGYPADTITSHGVIADGCNFLQKPFLPEKLNGRVREVLDSE
ncbi:MAG: PAS domain S-box protein [Candidatus Riflebacteria bacterium]|nr:PAS domain S-box protein [Candidatus Riflebacteria bacterium]